MDYSLGFLCKKNSSFDFFKQISAISRTPKPTLKEEQITLLLDFFQSLFGVVSHPIAKRFKFCKALFGERSSLEKYKKSDFENWKINLSKETLEKTQTIASTFLLPIIILDSACGFGSQSDSFSNETKKLLKQVKGDLSTPFFVAANILFALKGIKSAINCKESFDLIYKSVEKEGLFALVNGKRLKETLKTLTDFSLFSTLIGKQFLPDDLGKIAKSAYCISKLSSIAFKYEKMTQKDEKNKNREIEKTKELKEKVLNELREKFSRKCEFESIAEGA
jgi:hypothetical protein